MTNLGDNKRLLGIMGIRDPSAKVLRHQDRSGGFHKAIFSWFALPVGAPSEDLGIICSGPNSRKFLGKPMSFALEEEYRAERQSPGPTHLPNCRCFLHSTAKKATK